jgi:hypothetical protein
MGDPGGRARAKLEKSLRDMMRDATALPVPDHLVNLAATLEVDEGGQGEAAPQRWKSRGA